ncbi:hypothetical protein BACCOP_00241 [Phocaeicola coprocola DSM 17136]|uniref:Uncharacterized protein n=1 Tax=Phocaeicola coprocola DSM 17136 TaxID=470145 RepID=B3JEF0_9BACT|nr:hypothetical protein BACCOP_00241 [Phocaeicola coprocola DSM 17136]
MFKKLCILLIFSKLKVIKLFNRQISYAQLSVHDIHYFIIIIVYLVMSLPYINKRQIIIY